MGHNNLLATVKSKSNATRNNLIGLGLSATLFISLMIAFWK